MSKTFVITGASAGIGRALALELARQGHSLGLTGRRLSALQSLRDELSAGQRGEQRFEIAEVDVDQQHVAMDQLRALFDKLGRVDSVVINAGVNGFTSVGKGQYDAERAILNTNLLGGIATANAAVEYFLEQGGGHIAGISSLASLQGMPKQAAYCASKAGFSMYLDALRTEHRDHNIRVTQIRPGFVKTDIMENIEKYPFAISAEQAAKEMAKALLREKRDVVVPFLPWAFLRPLFGHLPDAIWKRLA